MKITLPWPSAKLSPNARGKWAKKDDNRKAARSAGYWAAKQAGVGPDGFQFDEMALTFHPPDRRRRDLDNMLASCKAAIDGVSDACKWDDHKCDRITLERGQPMKPACVVLVLK